MSSIRSRAAVCALLFALLPCNALAWGYSGHRDINLAAARALPSSVPGFMHTEQAVAEMAYLGPEEDRLKGAGASWDRDLDPAHYVDLGDDGTIAGVAKIASLPADMEAYGKALDGAQTNAFRMGYLPYSIADGWEQLRKDFAYWRVFDYLATHADPQYRAEFAAARDLREQLTIRDAGVWGHFVGDGSQPLHVSVHFNGWGSFPNPQGFTTSPIHAMFEGAFVRDHVTEAAVEHLVPAQPPAPASALLSQTDILAFTGSYLATTASTVPQLYTIEKAGGFQQGSPQAVAFTTARVAAGAIELRNLIVSAWENSQYAKVGYPEIAVSDILSGKVTPPAAAFGGD